MMTIDKEPGAAHKHDGGLTVQWAALAAVAGASTAVIGALAFGMGFAALPLRVTAVEQRQQKLEVQLEKLSDELSNGRKERLQFQGETRSDLAVLKSESKVLNEKLDDLKRILEMRQ